MRTADIKKAITAGTVMVIDEPNADYTYSRRYGVPADTGVTRRLKSGGRWGGSAQDGIKILRTDEDGTPITDPKPVPVGRALGYKTRYVPRWTRGDKAAARDKALNAHMARPVVDDYGNVVTEDVQRSEVVRPAEVIEPVAELRARIAEREAAAARRAADAEQARAEASDDLARMGDAGRALAHTYRDSASGLQSAITRVMDATVTDLSAGAGVLLRIVTGGGYPRTHTVAIVDGAVRNVRTEQYDRRGYDVADEVLAVLAVNDLLPTD